MEVSRVLLSSVLLILLGSCTLGRSHSVKISQDASSFILHKDNKFVGKVEVTNTNGRIYKSVDCGNGETLCRDFGSHKLYAQKSGYCFHIWNNENYWYIEDAGDGIRITSTYNITGHLYGGPEQSHQNWPLDDDVYTNYSYVTKEEDHQGFAERYWLMSDGTFFYINEDASLFLQQNVEGKTIQFIVENVAPYPSPRPLRINETVCYYPNAKIAHMAAVETFLNKPSAIPDERMIKYPIWSTWARYKADVNETVVLTFADEITQNGFQNSQLEVDDRWEICYGSLTFDQEKFPNMRSLTDTLHKRGFRVTLWVHPFINIDCLPYYAQAEALDYFVKNKTGHKEIHWWNGEASIIDMTNEEAASKWTEKLKTLVSENGIDGIKFDAGETSWLPQVPVLNGDLTQQPNLYTKKYLEIVEKFGKISEARVGYLSQHYPFFLRMLDLDSRWNFENGLPTLITTLLQMNMIGYPFVLPDMVGGNGYEPEGRPSKELFIRWLQANVFMPAIQYSYVPWDYDKETVDICKRYTELHEKYAPKIIEVMRQAVETGAPVNPPVWWIDPEDEDAQVINDEYLLGEEILVAPVVVQGSTRRDIYLPKGKWEDQLRGSIIDGPKWLHNYSVALNELAYFVQVSAAGVTLGNTILLLSLLTGLLLLNRNFL